MKAKNKQAKYEFVLEQISILPGAKILGTLNNNLDLQEKRLSNGSKKDINRSHDYLHASFNQDFSLEYFSELAGFRQYHLKLVFKKET